MIPYDDSAFRPRHMHGHTNYPIFMHQLVWLAMRYLRRKSMQHGVFAVEPNLVHGGNIASTLGVWTTFVQRRVPGTTRLEFIPQWRQKAISVH